MRANTISNGTRTFCFNTVRKCYKSRHLFREQPRKTQCFTSSKKTRIVVLIYIPNRETFCLFILPRCNFTDFNVASKRGDIRSFMGIFSFMDSDQPFDKILRLSWKRYRVIIASRNSVARPWRQRYYAYCYATRELCEMWCNGVLLYIRVDILRWITWCAMEITVFRLFPSPFATPRLLILGNQEKERSNTPISRIMKEIKRQTFTES